MKDADAAGQGGGPTRLEAEPGLIERARHDRAAFASLYDFYVARIYAFCAVHSASREDAEDLTAQTFERALGAIARYEERGQPFSAWLLRIAANAAANRSRRPMPVPLLADESQPPSPSSRDDATIAQLAESWVEEWERADWIAGHLEALPADQRHVVRLRFFEDRSFDDVAVQMGRSEGAVKQLLRRSLMALRGRIGEDMLHDS